MRTHYVLCICVFAWK